MKVSYEYDQDPRYGWASISVDGEVENLIVVHTEEGGSYGFSFCDGEMTPTCICHAYSESECACPNVVWTHYTQQGD